MQSYAHMKATTLVGSLRQPWLALVAMAATPVCTSLASTATATQSLNALIYPIAKLSVPATVALSAGATRFSSFTGSAAVSYRLRTTPSGGGNITLQVTSDFTPAGGPSAGSGALTYTCAGATIGTSCSGTQTASTTVQTPVLTLPASACTGGGGACSSQDPNSVTLSFNVPDDPGYATGSYSARLTFVISAT